MNTLIKFTSVEECRYIESRLENLGYVKGTYYKDVDIIESEINTIGILKNGTFQLFSFTKCDVCTTIEQFLENYENFT